MGIEGVGKGKGEGEGEGGGMEVEGRRLQGEALGVLRKEKKRKSVEFNGERGVGRR